MKSYRQILAASVLLSTAPIFAACSVASPSQGDPNEFDVDTQFTVTPEASAAPRALTEAPAGFDNLTNGFSAQTDMNTAKAQFDTTEAFSDGIGPVFNNISCISCHANPFGPGRAPAVGTGSQISELRAGHFNGTNFIDHPGGSLINDRANDASIQEHVLAGNEVRRLRRSPSASRATASSRRSTATRSPGSPTTSRPASAARSSRSRSPRPRATTASAGSAGRTRTRACCRSRVTPTSTRWASPTGCSRPRTPRTAPSSRAARSTARPIRRRRRG